MIDIHTLTSSVDMTKLLDLLKQNKSNVNDSEINLIPIIEVFKER